MQNTRRAFVRRTLLFLGLGTLAVIAVIATSLWVGERNRIRTVELSDALEAKVRIAAILGDVRDAETGQRGYLITQEHRYLEPFTAAAERLPRNLGSLRAVLKGEPGERLLPELEADIADRLGILTQTVELANSGRRGEAVALVRGGRGKDLMDRIRGQLAILDAQASEKARVGVEGVQQTSDWLRVVTLAGAFLAMVFGIAVSLTIRRYLDELFRTRTELSDLNRKLDERVQERTTELQRANDEIQRFAYIVSHDLRAPLVNIMGFTSELEHSFDQVKKQVPALAGAAWEAPEAADVRAAVEADVPEAIGFIRSSTRKMDNLINAILRLSREGGRVLAPQQVDLNAMFAQIASSLGHQMLEKNVDFAVEGRLPAVFADRLALEQVFGNLMDNAVKYLSPDRRGVIRVRGREDRNRIYIDIVDNGRGIAPADRDRVFELFRRAGPQDQPGDGIGLAHVRALVRRMGGDIDIDPDTPTGTSFRVMLPRQMPPSTKE